MSLLMLPDDHTSCIKFSDFLIWCLFWCCLMITRVAFNSLIVFHFWKRIFWFWCCLMITLVAFKSQIVFQFWQRICVVMKLWFINLMSLLMVLVSYAAGNTQDSCNIFSPPIPNPNPKNKKNPNKHHSYKINKNLDF